MSADITPPPKSWVDALDRAEEDVAAGRVVDGPEIHRELRAAIERIEAREGADKKPRTPAVR
jgi:hypothetical protein